MLKTIRFSKGRTNPAAGASPHRGEYESHRRIVSQDLLERRLYTGQTYMSSKSPNIYKGPSPSVESLKICVGPVCSIFRRFHDPISPVISIIHKKMSSRTRVDMGQSSTNKVNVIFSQPIEAGQTLNITNSDGKTVPGEKNNDRRRRKTDSRKGKTTKSRSAANESKEPVTDTLHGLIKAQALREEQKQESRKSSPPVRPVIVG